MKRLILICLGLSGNLSLANDLSDIIETKNPNQLNRLLSRQEHEAIVSGACQVQRKSSRLTLACPDRRELEARCLRVNIENVDSADIVKAWRIKGLSHPCKQRLRDLLKVLQYKSQDGDLGATFERLIEHDKNTGHAGPRINRTGRFNRAGR